ncbi:MAG TPA: hypothetical protein VHC70_05435 [Phycisphaerales bacterium]|nr:hypothetical protein [Phycisphaerales bacterium]
MSEFPVSPPVIPAELAAPPRRVVWPTVIGVLAIVFGALGCLQSLGGLILPLMIPMMDAVASQMPAGRGPQVNPFATMHRYIWVIEGGYLVLAVLAVCLIVLGIGLTRRSAWAGGGMRLWGACALLGAIGLGAMWGCVEGSMMTDVMQSAQTSGPSGSMRGGPPPEFGRVMGIVVGVMVSVFLSIFPLFITIWFSVRSVRAEVERWRSGVAR